MIVLQIEHPVPDFNRWKKAFDSDPMNRNQSGVKRHQIFTQKENPDYVIISLEFANVENAEVMLSRLQKIME